MQGGSLTIAGPLSVNGNSVTPGSGATSVFGGTSSAGSAFGSGIFLQGSGTLGFTPGAGNTQTISDVIADEAGVVARGYTPPAGTFAGTEKWGLSLSGGGTLILSAANQYSGGTSVTQGTLSLNHATAGTIDAASSGRITIGSATLAIAGNGKLANAVTLTDHAAAVIDTAPGALVTFAGAIGGAGGVTFTGGTEVLAGTNTYAGPTTVATGTVRAGSTTGFSADSAFTVVSGATLDLGGFNETIGSLAGAGTVGNTGAALAVLTTGGNNSSTTFSGSIVDDGPTGLTKTGSGTLTLSGTNTYTGPTTVAGGTLQAGSMTGFSAGSTFTVAAGAALDLGGFNETIGSLAGAGTVGNTGAALAVLTTGGDNSSTTFSGSIVDDGPTGLTKTGSGTFILSGANTYTGPTTVGGGTLQAGSTTGFSAASAFTVAAGAALDLGGFNETIGSLAGAGTVGNTGAALAVLTTGGDNSSTTFSGVIQDDGPTGLTKTGSGTLTLSGTNTYTGPTTVVGGTLVVAGSAAASAATVEAGATLGGSGTIGGLTVAGDATAAPGVITPYTTLHVAGPVTFQSGSTYAVGIDPTGRTDLITATGAATLQGGTVAVTAAPGTYLATQRFTILTASGVSGRFAGLTTTSNLAFLNPFLGYDPADVYLGFVRNTVTFPSVGITPNQRATGGAVQAQGAGNAIYDTVLTQSAAGARGAFDALSGEIHASAVTAAFEDSRLPREAILDHLHDTIGGPMAPAASTNGFVNADLPAFVAARAPTVYGAWGQAFGNWGRTAGDRNAATLDRDTGGFILGLDASPDGRSRVGVAGGYLSTSLDVKGRASSGSVDSAFGALYAGTTFGRFNLEAGGVYAGNGYRTSRTIAFPGFADVATSHSGGGTAQGFGEVGYWVPYGRAVFEPFVQGAVIDVSTDGYTERGGAAALTGRGRDYQVGTVTAGVRAQTQLSFGQFPMTAKAMLGWRGAYGDVRPVALVAFGGGAVPFGVAGVPIDRNALAVEGSLDWRVGQRTTLGVSYSGQIGDHAEDHALKGKLEVAF